jgi:hypothetical protein
MATVASSSGRAAAILTNLEVKGTTLDLQTTTADGRVTVDLSFTIGSLTNMIVVFYGSADDITWDPLHNGVALLTETLTATAERMYTISTAGIRYFTVGVTGTDTLTSSSCAFTYRYNRAYQTGTQTDGVLRLS